MTCQVPSAFMDVVSGRISSRAYAERIPLWGHVEIIATCNFKCQHCFIAPCAERSDVMPLARAERLFDTLAEAGCLQLLLTGGEVFTHREFREIYLAAKRRGFLVYVNTNAYLIGERWADFLAEWPPEFISISLYGLSDERYEKVTGIPNAFRRVVRALDLLLERDLRMELKCPAMTLTADEIPGMNAFAKARGLKFRFDSVITPEEKGGMSPLQLQLAPKKIVELEQGMDGGYADLKEFAEKHRFAPDQSVYRCGAGKISLHIDVHGGVTTCLSSRQVVANIFEQPWDEVWAILGGKVARKFPDGHPCATCSFRPICSGCPATVEQVTGLPEGYVQQYCKITHLRAYTAGLHPTGVPRTVTEGIPAGVRVTMESAARALPVLN